MKYKCSLLLSIILIHSITSELRFVYNIFRHGARSPSLPKGKLTDMLGKPWQGSGELTTIGMRMHYILGARNKIKYDGFLSKHYDQNEIYVMSTYKDRTLLSVLSHLNGLYPPETGPTISEVTEDIAVPPVAINNIKDIQRDLNLNALKFRAQAIPVHIIPKSTRSFFLHDKGNCPPVGQIKKQNLENQAIKNYVKKFKEEWSAVLMKALDLKEEFFDSFENLHVLCDAFSFGYTEGHDYSFLEKAGINLEDFYKTAEENSYIKYSNIFEDKDNFVGHMSMSPFHLSIVEWMDTRVKYDKEGLGYVTYKAPKYVMLSGHDTNIGAIQAYFKKVFPDLFPGYQPIPFAASLFYELHRKAGVATYAHKDYYVEVVYNDKLLFTLDYDQFRSNIMTKSFEQEDIDSYCGFNVNVDSTSYIDTGLVIASTCLAIISMVLMIMFIVLWRKRKLTHKTRDVDTPLV
jgi:hypothetical protein